MSFNPSYGPWATEDFSSAEGLTLSSGQTINGGYLTLSTNATGAKGFSSRWAQINNWTLVNDLNTISTITGDFTRQSGAVITGQIIPLTGANGVRQDYSGYQRHIDIGGMYSFYTPTPTYISNPLFTGYSGQVTQSIVLDKRSPDTSWYDTFNGGGTELTLEFDVISTQDIYTGTVSIGYSTGQELLNSLPALRNQLLNHGIYIDNGQYWDYLEVNPFGIRSINHPEFGIPLDLSSTPKRIRIGIVSQNVIIATEEGLGVLGLSILNTPVDLVSDAKIAFGAPRITGDNNRYPLINKGLSGIVGFSLWDNIKILYGASYVTSLTGNFLYYPTTPQTGYTEVYDPGYPITNWNSAKIGYVPYNTSSVTSVTFQYSGVTGWTDGPSATLTDTTSSVKFLDLSTVPVFFNSRTASTHGRISNPVRFRIIQQSDGRVQPPSIDFITVSAASERAYLDIVPNWKPVNTRAVVQLAVKEKEFIDLVANPNKFTTFLLNSPLTTGVKANQVITYEDSIYTGAVCSSGQADVVYGGFNSTSIRNFVYTGIKAVTGSTAYDLLGPNFVTNCFYNQDLEDFQPVSSDIRYIANRTIGDIALGINIPDSYTGRSRIYYNRQETYRPIFASDSRRSAEILNREQQLIYSNVQNVVIPPQGDIIPHDSTCGIEVDIPSGICSGLFLFSADLQVLDGTGLYIYATGTNVVNVTGHYINASYYREFNPVSMTVRCSPSATTTGRVRVGIVASPGTPSSSSINFNIDNISFSPIRTGFVFCTGISTYLHQSGLLRASVAGTLQVPAVRCATTAGLDVKIQAYPTGQTGILLAKKRNSDSKGFELYCTNNGNLAIKYESESQSWAYGSSEITPFTGSQLSSGYISDYVLPLNKWVTVGFVHQAETFYKLGNLSYSGAAAPTNFAATNRIYLLVDGAPVAVTDLMRHWNNAHFTLNNDCAPHLSYLVDGSGVVTIGSGLVMEFDAVQLDKPPAADSEMDFSIKIAKTSTPYFVPEFYLKPTFDETISNFMVADNASLTLGGDLFLGSIYNFDSPGFTNWDHGPWRNHLLFHGNVRKLALSPYDSSGIYGLGSTYFSGTSYAVAKYSSATERQFNSSGNLNIPRTYYTDYGCNTNSLKVFGWTYPFGTGVNIFEVFEDSQNFSGRSIQFGYTTGMNTVLRMKTGISDIWAITGNIVHEVGKWNWIGFNAFFADITGGVNTAVLFSNSGIDKTEVYQFLSTTGGFRYAGKSGHTFESCFVFGRNSNVALADFAVTSPFPFDSTVTDPNIIMSNCYGNKSGRYNVIMENENIFTGEYVTSGFKYMYVTLEKDSLPRESMLWAATHNSYDNTCRLNGGIHLFDDEPFKRTSSYYLNFDNTPITNLVGTMISPIKIGNQVPSEAVNLARLTSPGFNAASAVTTIDLADSNPSNLLAYRNGRYPIDVGLGRVSGYTSTGSFKGINSRMFTGRVDYEFSGQVYTEDINVSTIVLSSPDSSNSYPGYYYYLIGRGQYGIYANGTAPHPENTLTMTSTGQIVNTYVSNIEKIKSIISIKDSAGRTLSFDEYPYDIITSPITPADLPIAIPSGISVNPEGVYIYAPGNGVYNAILPSQVFSVILVLHKDTISSNSSAWVHYPSYNIKTKSADIGKKEVINASPIMRKDIPGESALPGRYSMILDPVSYLYTVKIFGVDNEYSGKL